MNLAKLKDEIKYKYKVQTSNSYGSTLVAYIDARDVMNVLDDVVGPENWTNDYRYIGSQMMCRIGIRTSEGWVYKEDGGTTGQFEKDKSLISDSLKRCSVLWGISRFLYDLQLFKISSIELNGKWLPAHDSQKYGPVTNVPPGILKYKSLAIANINRYVWEYLRPWSEKKKQKAA